MILKNAVRFVYEVKNELAKVVWPKWDEFVGSTVVVLVFVFMSAIYLGLLDLVFSKFAWFMFNRYGG